MTDHPAVSVVGLGAMGSRLASNLLTDRFAVTVANRSAPRASTLAERGARVAESPATAAATADVVLVAVTDDEASRQVWTATGSGVLAGLRAGAVAVECSTVSPGWVRDLAAAAAGAGARFVEAPMIGSRPQADARQLVHLVGGEVADIDAVRPVLEVTATRIIHTGAVATAATVKLLVNAMLATQVAAWAELLGIAARAGVSPQAAHELLGSLPVASPAGIRAVGGMLAGHAAGAFPPNFPVDLVAKDLRYLTELAAEVGARAPATQATLAEYRGLSADGHGAEDLTALARRFLPPG